MAISDYSTVPSANTSISGINIGEGCNAANINDALRQMMADIAGGSFTPTGVVADFAGSTAPAGWLLCDGSAVSRTGTTAKLFAAINTTWGAGDGSTTFNLPDPRGKAKIGAGQGVSLTNRPLASVGGEENHVLLVAEVPALTAAGSTSAGSPHAHGVNDAGHGHGTNAIATPVSGTTIVGGSGYNLPTATNSTAVTGITLATEATHTHTVSLTTTGGGGAHNNMQPFIAFNQIIKL